MNWYKKANINDSLKDTEKSLWVKFLEKQKENNPTYITILNTIIYNYPEALQEFFDNPDPSNTKVKKNITGLISRNIYYGLHVIKNTLWGIMQSEKMIKKEDIDPTDMTNLKNEFYQIVKQAFNNEPTIPKIFENPEDFLKECHNLRSFTDHLMNTTFPQNVSMALGYYRAIEKLHLLALNYQKKLSKLIVMHDKKYHKA